MGNLLAYLIVSGLIMVFMYLMYKLFLARDKQNVFNRGILLLIYLISFCAFPIYNQISKIKEVKPAIEKTFNITDLGNFSIGTSEQPIWGTVLIWIFLMGATTVAVKTILTWIRIIRVVHSGEKIKKDNYTLILINNDKIAPFSWIRYLVINRNDFYNKNSAIIVHELKHINSWHWLDLVVAQIVCVINWFNPVAWLMRDELMLVHEYQADMAVLESGHNPQEYQMLLIKKAVGAKFPSLVNSINHSKLKKRISMMYKSKSDAKCKWKALVLVPMVVLALFGIVTVPKVKAAVSIISNSKIKLEKGSDETMVIGKYRITSLNISQNETTVVIYGEDLGQSLSVSDVTFINKGTNYSASSIKTEKTNSQAIITANFPFSANFEEAFVSLNINGREINLSLDDFGNNSSSSPSKGRVFSHGNATLTTVGDVKIYLDGKQISEEELQSYNLETIASMSFDKHNHIIYLTSK